MDEENIGEGEKQDIKGKVGSRNRFLWHWHTPVDESLLVDQCHAVDTWISSRA